MKRVLTLFVVLGLVALLAGGASANLLLNGDLDSPGPGATIDNWTKDESKTFSGPTSDLVTLESWIELPPITNGGGDNDLGAFIKAFQGNPTTGDLATLHLYQDVAGAAGLEYRLSFIIGAGANYSGLIDPDVTKTELAIEFDNDNDRGNGLVGSAVLDLSYSLVAGGPSVGQNFAVTGIAPAGTSVARARFSMIDGYLTQNPDPSAFIDDFDLTVVPEPAALTLLGLGLIGLVALRRR